MLRAIVGSMVGGLVAGAVAIVASAPARSIQAVPEPMPSAESRDIVDASGSRAPNLAPSSPASSGTVECEPHQRAELRRVSLNGREIAQVTCATVLQPVTYDESDIATASVPAQRSMVERPAVVRERVGAREPARRAATKRSWAKSALIIGGGTGAGAGVGGLVGGKKGALLGAAIGGGSAAIFEAVKRR